MEMNTRPLWVTGCTSWYLGKDGIPVLWPWTPARHRELLAEPVLQDLPSEKLPNWAPLPDARSSPELPVPT